MLVPLLVLAPPAYRIVDLGLPLGACEVRATAINNRGEVLVATPIRDTGRRNDIGAVFESGRAYLWRAGRFLDFGDPGGESAANDTSKTEPTGLNDHGVAVGGKGPYGPVFMTGLEHAAPFIWRGRGLESLGVDELGQANHINNLGDIVGDAGHGAFARLKGRIVMLPQASHVEPHDPSGEMGDVNQSSGVAINDHRLILINSTYGGKHGDANLPSRPFLIDGSRMPLRLRPVPLPKGVRDGRGIALNDRGTALIVANEPYLVRGGHLVRLPFAGPMNGRDEVVGSSPLSVWRSGKSTPLPTLPGWTLQTATGINDQGAICGTGLHGGKTRAYVLLPQR